jgi:Fur family zinc uptake transcriptional regulator
MAHAQAVCAGRGATLTETRALVLELLLRREGTAKAYDLLADMQQRQPGVAPMTVYRALDFLVEHGLVHKVASNSSFVVCRHADHPHLDPVFMVCGQCGTATEWDDPAMGKHLARALATTGFHAQGVEIKGECARCAATGSTPGPAAHSR